MSFKRKKCMVEMQTAGSLNLDNIGGKARSLVQLEQLVKVPPFCIIPTNYFAKFVAQTEIEQSILSLVREQNYAGAKKLILSTELPDEIACEIADMVSDLACDLFSVRSSAINEDGEKKSFAGQYDSFLFVKKEDVPTFVKKCWASLYNVNVAQYRDESSDLTGMAVVVQKMIDAVKSGIAFSQDPTGKTEDLLIEAAQGVGENVVSGIITPCRYYVSLDDHIKGENAFLSSCEVFEIAQTLRTLTEEFGCPLDSEWCISPDGSLYFLQARPITAIAVPKKPYVSYLSRPFSLMRVQLYYLGEYEGIRRLTDGHYYLNPLFIQKRGEVHIYYNNISQKENPANIFSYIEQNVDMAIAFEEMVQRANRIKSILFDGAPFLWDSFLNDLIYLYPFSTLGNIAGRSADLVVKKLMPWLKQFREQYDKIMWMAEDFLCEKAIAKVGEEYKNTVLLEEAFGETSIRQKDIQSRQKGYLFFNGQLVIDEDENTLNNYINANNIYLKDMNEVVLENKLICGAGAYGGRVEGKVRIIRKMSDIPNFQKGEIIVSPMTVPQYSQIMKDSIGIITDEGGILCHAAIVARELMIPCVIGCKNATLLLHDGDRVLINGDDGTVKILS